MDEFDSFMARTSSSLTCQKPALATRKQEAHERILWQVGLDVLRNALGPWYAEVAERISLRLALYIRDKNECQAVFAAGSTHPVVFLLPAGIC